MFAGTDKDEMKKESEFWSIMFLVIGVVSFVANIIQVNLGFICMFKYNIFNEKVVR